MLNSSSHFEDKKENVMDRLNELETRIIEALAADYGGIDVPGLTAQQEADVRRLTTKKAVLQTADAIRDYLKARLALSVELMGDHCSEEQWRRGVEGAILEGRTSIVRELLDWLEKIPCSECGSYIAEGAKFCGECGASSPTPIPGD
jgi:NAD dependent epimerase/dehydratase family enzyme